LHFLSSFLNLMMALNLGNESNAEVIITLDEAFRVSFDEGLMEDPGAKSPFYYNNVPVVSQADDSDIGEILSSVLNIFRDMVEKKYSFIADDLAGQLNITLFELFEANFVSRPGKFSPFYFENIAIFPKNKDAGDLNKFIEDSKFLFLFTIRGY
jgi:hypothetical protein